MIHVLTCITWMYIADCVGIYFSIMIRSFVIIFIIVDMISYMIKSDWIFAVIIQNNYDTRERYELLVLIKAHNTTK